MSPETSPAKLRCSQYETEMLPENAKCPSPENYCQYRSSCLIWREMRKTRLENDLREKERQLAELLKRMPAHTPAAIMLQEQDELEDDIARIRRELEDIE